MLEYLIPLIVFSGLILGVILAKVSPEEMKSGERYFKILKKITLTILIISLIFLAIPLFLELILGLVVGYIAALLLKRVYFFLGLALFLSFLTSIPDLILLFSSIVFIFGLPTGSLIASEVKKKKDLYLSMILNAIFFLSPFLLFFIRDLLANNLAFPLAFTAGSLLYIIRY